MSLSKHINADRLIQAAKDKKHGHHFANLTQNKPHASLVYGSRYGTDAIPKFSMPSKGIDPEAAYQVIHDELTLDGSPVLNLASFVHTWMPPAADRLMMENQSKNLIDSDEYPMTQIIHNRCVSMLADLWHAPSAQNAIGTATTGSSEAIQLGGLAMKRLWQEKRKAAGKSIHEPGPNIVMGANAQVALEKFARYFDVECRLVPVSVESHYRLDPKKTMEYVDENTIGVYVILGSTYTGHYGVLFSFPGGFADRVRQSLSRRWRTCWTSTRRRQATRSPSMAIDGASGGFVAPFATPKLLWDFKIPRVVSINTSGHKFGLAYVGVGWVIWRDKQHLPKDLIFELHYLGSVEYSFSLNFSRPAAPIIAQYFNLISLGFEGYRSVALNDLKNARLLSRALENSEYYTVLSDIHRADPSIAASIKGVVDSDDSYVPGLPVVSFRFSDKVKTEHPELQQHWIQVLLRARGWIVPNYELPPNEQATEILRVVVRENLTEPLIERLVNDLMEITEDLLKRDSSTHALDVLGSGQSKQQHGHERAHGKLDEGHSSAPSGTYAKTC
ncbi:Glutamate decarboxylase [Mycena chlorophos]|uniref:Glutamate decarboxylase n=1 Tax=Mycena chlorophos TaxID=658473 RepID=A0A8H6TS75_MYCCL|nr:Glutamate decarboxylase [Mycena chlorophos]